MSMTGFVTVRNVKIVCFEDIRTYVIVLLLSFIVSQRNCLLVCPTVISIVEIISFAGELRVCSGG